MEGAFGNEGALPLYWLAARANISYLDFTPMPSELPPEEDRPGVPIAPPLLFVLPILASLAVEWLAPTSFMHGALRGMLGVLTFVIGITLGGCGFIAQKRAGTDPIPFNPTTRIVAHGVYRLTRNPMYLGFALCTLALSILVDSTWMLLAVPIGLVLVDRMIITREERYLERKFGEEYLRYKRRVRRWIWLQGAERRAAVDCVGYSMQASRQARRWETLSSVSSPMLERRKVLPLILP